MRKIFSYYTYCVMKCTFQRDVYVSIWVILMTCMLVILAYHTRWNFQEKCERSGWVFVTANKWAECSFTP